MKGDPKVIEYLNEALKNELTAINQYWLHYRLLDHWGVKQARRVRAARIDRRDEACRHGWRSASCSSTACPISSCSAACASARRSRRCCKADLALEIEAVPQLRDAIAHCEKVRDYVSRDLFRRILDSEEEHVDTLERQFEMIERMGIHNYIQLNSVAEDDAAKSGAAP